MIEKLDTGIVYENPKPYLYARHAFHPTLVDLDHGQFLCAFDLGEAVEGLDYHTCRSRSGDGGATWRFEGPILAMPPCPSRPTTHSIRLSRTPSGLVGAGALMYREDQEEGIVNRENMGYAPMDLITVRSEDGGVSWSKPEIVRPPLIGPAFEVCHGIIELPGGRWLWPTSTWRGWNGDLPNGQKALVLISDNHGKSWPEYGVSFDGDADGVILWEQSVISLGGNDVLAVVWVYHPGSGANRPNRYAISHDGGKTFGRARESGLDGQTCKALRLRDGRILCAYRRNDKPGLWANLSRLNGEKWENLSELPLWGTLLSNSGMTGERESAEELSALKFGFPQMLQSADGDVLLVFWCFEDWSSKIRWMRLRVTP